MFLLNLPDGTIHVTASIGVAGFGEGFLVEHAEELIELADQALYRAKDGGRNRVELWSNN